LQSFYFNFGDILKAPREGQIKITGDMLFDENIGYGLLKKTDSVVRELKEERIETYCDFLKMQKNGFKVKIENGHYNVRVRAGDYEDEGDITVKVMESGKPLGGIWVMDGSISEGVYPVQVTQGFLEFEFDCRYITAYDRYAGVTSLEIAPLLVGEVKGLETQISFDGIHPKLTLSWQKSSHFHAYKVKKYDMQRNILVATYEVLENILVDEQVEVAKTYRYDVVGMDAFSFEASYTSKEVSIANGEIPPRAPQLVLDEVSANKVKVSWSQVEGALDYTVYQKAKHGLFKKLITTKALTYTDEEVCTCEKFIYAVEARTLAGNTPKSTVETSIEAPSFKRQMEKLDRGLVAMETAGGIFLSWRLTGEEYEKDTCFHLYRNEEKIARVTTSTNYLDEQGSAKDLYTVKAIDQEGKEIDSYVAKVITGGYLPIPIDKPAPYETPDGKVHEYSANDIAVADLDGDGEYEIILKWDAGSHDNAHAGYTGIVYLDAYKLSGKKLWRIDLGVNIRAGAHYTQFIAYDLDGDGKAEIVCKTADGTKDGLGNVLGDAKADYRNKSGYIIEGPEYLSAFNGETGAFIDTVEYDPPRGNVSDWGDSWGNRVDRFLAAVAYLDGEHPSVIMCRGYYDHGRPTVLVAYDLKEGKLQKRWKFLANKDQNIEYTNQGNHNIAIGDIDGDGKDEIVYGACAIDHDGTGIYSTGLEHGDALHMGKFDPTTEGLDYYQIHEHGNCPYGLEVRNPATGEVLWGKFVGKDTARGLTANIDPRYEGNEVWSYFGGGLYTYRGEKITEKMPESANFAIWWDGDLQRELLDHKWLGKEVGKGIGVIYKWDWEKEELVTILDTKDAYSNNGTKGNPCIQADLFGDWREEVIWRNEDSTELRVYTTTDLTEHKFYTLMHDHVYRLGIAWQNVAYNQPPHTGFYIGKNMKKPPIPRSRYI
jgi:fibronectin type 3 domain-containing protein